MSERISFHTDVVVHASAGALVEPDRVLVDAAIEASTRAYAPYSRFRVGAALRMENGTVTTGNNQENASFPAGTCAERTALHAAMAQWPTANVTTMAIAVPDARGEGPVSPCGVCRQALLEQERRQNGPIRLLLRANDGRIFEVARAGDLLPLSFDGSQLPG